MPACQINQNIGNCYTGSVFSSLLSVIAAKVNFTVSVNFLFSSH